MQWPPFTDCVAFFSSQQMGAAGRGSAVGKRSRMRPGLPEHFNVKLHRPLLGEDKAGTDVTHIDVKSHPRCQDSTYS